MKRVIAFLLIVITILSVAGCSATISVSGAQIGEDGHLILSMSDGSTIDAGMAQGEQGVKGDTGAQGPQGEPGIQGPQGEQGPRGEKGEKGDAGADGADGRDGARGRDGADGTDGARGADGLTPYIGDNGNWWIGTTDTGVIAKGNDFIYNDRGNGTILLAYVGQDYDVVIPDKTTEIGEGAFQQNVALTTVIIPEHVEEIGDYAFIGCVSLSEVVFPDGLTDIGSYAFHECTSLSEVVFPDRLSTIGNYAFARNLDVIYGASAPFNIPDSVEYIGECAFMNSPLPNGNLVLNCQLGKKAFSGTAITDVRFTFSDSGTEAFSYCSKLKTVVMEFDPNSPYGTGGYMDMHYFVNIDIAEGMFKGCGALETVTLPTVTTALVDDWHNAFGGVPQIAEVEFRIFEYAFANCISLKSISLPSALQYIGDRAFGSSGLETVTVPNDTTNIGSEAFSYCRTLKSFYFDCSGHSTYISDDLLGGCDKLETVTIKGLTSIGDNAGWFTGCSSLRTVNLPDIQRLGSNAFAYSGLTSLVLPNSLAIVDRLAFNNSEILVLTIHATTPPQVSLPAWDFPYQLTDIFVPAAAVDAYKDAPGWSAYREIIKPIVP